MMHSAPCSHLASRILVLCGSGIASLAAAANVLAAENGFDWHELLASKAFACGAAAVVLFIVSLLLRGFLKVLSLAIVILLATGTYWFFRDAPERHAELLPHEWTALADRTLRLPKSQDAWKSLLTELSHQSHETRARLAVGADDARRVLLVQLDAKAAELRKTRHGIEAAELKKLRESIAKER
jgi:hypothetical protein